MWREYSYREEKVVIVLLENGVEELSEKLITEGYLLCGYFLSAAIQFKCFSFAIFYQRRHSNTLQGSHIREMEQSVTNQMTSDLDNLELYIYFLKTYAERMGFESSQSIIDRLEEIVKAIDQEKNFIHCHKNPIKLCALITELLQRLPHFPML